LRLNAEGRRISESRMRENRTYGLMRGRWKPHCSTLSKQYGNAIRLNGVLTDMLLTVGTPVNESFCGNCEECVRHCPGQAIKGNTWSLHVDRDNLLDAAGCKKAVMERGKAFNVAGGACGICIAVCPWTKRYFSFERRT
jgi:epoxyqueuosine reductase